MAKDWEMNALELKIVEFLLSPDHLKRGAVGKFLKANDINYKDYYKIKANPNFNAYLSKLSDDLMKGSLLEVTGALIRGAKKGSASQQKLYFEMMDRYVQKIEITSMAGEIKEMSTEDLEKLVVAGDK